MNIFHVGTTAAPTRHSYSVGTQTAAPQITPSIPRAYHLEDRAPPGPTTPRNEPPTNSEPRTNSSQVFSVIFNFRFLSGHTNTKQQTNTGQPTPGKQPTPGNQPTPSPQNRATNQHRETNQHIPPKTGQPTNTGQPIYNEQSPVPTTQQFRATCKFVPSGMLNFFRYFTSLFHSSQVFSPTPSISPRFCRFFRRVKFRRANFYVYFRQFLGKNKMAGGGA